MGSHLWRYLFAMLSLVLLAACTGKTSGAPAATVTSLQILELQPGAGAPIAAGQNAVVQYTGWLYDTAGPDKKGKQFDTSRNSGQPFRFVVGAGQVIKGWDQGVLGMSAGGRRRLTIPADLAYGDHGAGGVIPPGATLIFDVDLVAIE
jgi:FKBP-type peptidyl-prolyl cis-trans isomerase FkpA